MSSGLALALAERGLVPDPLVRRGIRTLLGARLRSERRRDPGSASARLARWREATAPLPIAIATEAANAQHYELPPAFFELVLGPRLKYSSCTWPDGVTTLADAEEAMLALATERAEITDGQRILDLGCGWGSMSLWLAERFPRARILAVSNSRPQGDFLRARAAALGLTNLEHRVADVNTLELPTDSFDRIVSIEMLEHVRNHARLFERIERWLAPDGKLFVHVFCHRELAYRFEDRGASDWMARYFFSGGIMPSADLLPALAGPLALDARWPVSGLDYSCTAEAWLANLDAHRAEALPILEQAYGGDARLWFERWRLFLLACAELFAFAGGREWFVSHYRFAKGAGPRPAAAIS